MFCKLPAIFFVYVIDLASDTDPLACKTDGNNVHTICDLCICVCGRCRITELDLDPIDLKMIHNSAQQENAFYRQPRD
jgi:hypothetical protein